MFKALTWDEIVKIFQDKLIAQFPEMKYTSDSNIYKINVPIMEEIKRIEELMSSYIDKNNYRYAEGVDLDKILENRDFPRRKESRAKGFWITRNSTPGTSALAGNVKFTDDKGNTFVNTEDFTVNQNGIAIIPIIAEVYGTNGNVEKNTINTIKTPIYGLVSGTNEQATAGGANYESDIEYRIRWENTRNADSFWNTDGIRNEILAVNGVKSCKVIENDDDNPKTVGGKAMPSRSRRYYVDGGADEDIAKAIFKKTDRAIEETGDITVKVKDTQGDERDVIFSRPTYVQVEYKIILDGAMSTDDARVIIENYIAESKINETLTSFNVTERIRHSIDCSNVINLEVHFSRNSSNYFSALKMDVFEKAINKEEDRGLRNEWSIW